MDWTKLETKLWGFDFLWLWEILVSILSSPITTNILLLLLLSEVGKLIKMRN
jgi:hypothetical protein